jgi:CheY-like chemotaxis protein
VTALRILLVEDDASLCEALAETLESLGHSVFATAATESEAVEAAVRCMPDLMIVDIDLGPGSGVAAVTRILQTRYVPHLFITGFLPEYRAIGVPVLRKPFRAADLLLSMEAALKLPPPVSYIAHE